MSGDNAGGHVGRLAYLYLNTGTYDVPIWTAVKKIGDVDIDDAAATNDRDTRESGNTKTTVGNSKFGIKFGYEHKRGITDPVYTLLMKSRRTKCNLDTLALSDKVETEGAEGIRGPFVVTVSNRAEPINDAVEVSFEMYEGYEYDDTGEIVDTIPVAVGGSGLAEIDYTA